MSSMYCLCSPFQIIDLILDPYGRTRYTDENNDDVTNFGVFLAALLLSIE